jgi:flagellar export protein FliJ
VKTYHFRLATVARIRALEERVAAERFMTAQRDLRQARESARAAWNALAALQAPQGEVEMSTFIWLGDQADRLSESVRLCSEKVAEAEAACAQARAAWDVAVRRSGVLERLGEQGLVRWRSESQREEAAELDDLSLARYGQVGARR